MRNLFRIFETVRPEMDELPASTHHSRLPWSRLCDLGIMLALFLAALIFVNSDRNPFERDWKRDTYFYQRYYATAVMSACGRGWFSVVPAEVPALEDFLSLRADSFSCEDLPADVTTRPPNYQAVSYYYLFRSVELTWRLRGRISWKGLKPLFGSLCGLLMVTAYGTFRLGMGRILASAGTLAFFPLQLIWVPYLRDYAKAPFFLLIFLLLGWMIRLQVRPRRLLGLATAAGLTIGIALGLRPDISVTVPFVTITLLFFLPGRIRDNLRIKLLALAAFFTALFLAYSPMLPLEKTTFATSHAILNGFGNRFTDAMGLNRSLYEWSHIFSDPWTDFQVKSYALYEKGIERPVLTYSEEYDRIGREMISEVVRDRPADILIRAYASALQIIKIPIFFCVLLALISIRSMRHAIFLFLAILYFTGYPGTQFHPRHFFHLEFLPLWLVGFSIDRGLRFCIRIVTNARELRVASLLQGLPTFREVFTVRLLVSVGSATLLLLFPLLILRTYQSPVVAELLESYDGAPLEVLSSETLDRGQNLVLVEPKNFLVSLPTSANQKLSVGYLVVELFGESCSSETVEFVLRYEPGAYHDFSRTVEAKLSGRGVTKIFAPIYSRERSGFGDSAFLGVELEREMLGCLRLSKVADLHRFPPILYVTLPEDWHEKPLYQTVAHVPGRRDLKKIFNQINFRWRKIISRLSRTSFRRASLPVRDWVPIFADDFETGHLDRWHLAGRSQSSRRGASQAQMEKEK